jgi:NAD(P)-dependent dehydrogenase (short-subunit alcohol dehydrogenase family)
VTLSHWLKLEYKALFKFKAIVQPPFDLTGRRILVAGASAGIGASTAILLSKLGAQVVLHGRDLKRLNEVLDQLSGKGHVISAFDLNQLDEVPSWLKGVICAERPLDGIAYCVGVQTTIPVRNFSTKHFDLVMHTNLGSALALTRGFRQRGCHSPGASMVLVSSIGGLLGQPGNVVYGASKAGLMSAARGLAMELLRDDIRVNSVAPAMIDTAMSRKAFSEMTEAQIEGILKRHPMGMGKPEDVAGPIAFLLSDASRWINGANLTVDGGHMVG